MQSNYAIFQKQPNTVGSFLQQGIGGLFNPRVTTDINDAASFLQSDFTDLNSLAPIILDNPTDVFANIIAENLLTQPDVLPPPIYDFDYSEPAPIDPVNLTPTNRLDYFDNLNPVPIDPVNYVQPPLGDEADTYPDSFGVSETVEDPIYNDPQMIVQDEVPGDGYIEEEFAPGFEATEYPIESIIEPIGRKIDTTTTTGTGTNPFYAGATNVAQPPSMTPIAPSFGLDVGVGSYGTPTNTAGFGNYDVGNIGGFGGFNIPSTLTPPEPTPTPATGVAPQTTGTPLPTVNSFAGFSGFGGFGGF